MSAHIGPMRGGFVLTRPESGRKRIKPPETAQLLVLLVSTSELVRRIVGRLSAWPHRGTTPPPPIGGEEEESFPL